MKLFYAIYQLWHIGVIAYVGFVITNKDSLTIKEDICPILLLVIFTIGLLYYYYRHFKLKRPIDWKSGITILSAEFLLIYLMIAVMLYFNFGESSLPG